MKASKAKEIIIKNKKLAVKQSVDDIIKAVIQYEGKIILDGYTSVYLIYDKKIYSPYDSSTYKTITHYDLTPEVIMTLENLGYKVIIESKTRTVYLNRFWGKTTREIPYTQYTVCV